MSRWFVSVTAAWSQFWNAFWGGNRDQSFSSRSWEAKLIGGVLHYVLFDYIADRDPKAAKVFSKVSVFVQGGVVVANLRFAF